jgi:AraC-like DNA-binding protein
VSLTLSSTIALPPHTATVGHTDSLGCVSHKLHKSLDICGDGIKFYRRRTDDAQLGHVSTPASDRGFLVGISMMPGHRRKIFHAHHSSSHDFNAGSVYVRSFSHDYRADLRGPFDFLLVEISGASFKRVIDERSGTRIKGLECVTGLPDPVLSNLACALAPALERPAETSRVFVEQMGTVIETYLLEQYGGGLRTATPKAKALSRVHERRAKDMLLSRLDGNASIADIAEACSLSRSHFIRTFRETTGQTPHQWLQAQRVEHARQLLRDTKTSIAEIATLCGFADQSHFTRVFTQLVGATPGRWRREIQT